MIFSGFHLLLEESSEHFVPSLEEVRSLAEFPLSSDPPLVLFGVDALLSGFFGSCSLGSLLSLSWLFLSHFVV